MSRWAGPSRALVVVAAAAGLVLTAGAIEGFVTGSGLPTGLRVGIMSAKALAYATGCRLVAVPTFAAIALQVPAEAVHVWVIADALQGQIYLQRFERGAVADGGEEDGGAGGGGGGVAEAWYQGEDRVEADSDIGARDSKEVVEPFCDESGEEPPDVGDRGLGIRRATVRAGESSPCGVAAGRDDFIGIDGGWIGHKAARRRRPGG